MGRRSCVVRAVLWSLPLLAPAAAADERAAPREIVYAGRVVDSHGAPVAGATVHVITGPPPQVVVHDALLPWRSVAVAPPVEPVGGSRLTTAAAPTGADGRFAVTGVPAPAGGYVVVVHAEFRCSRVRADPRVLTDGTVDVGDVRLDRGGRLRALVRDPDGKPVEGATVVVQPRHMPRDRYSPGEIRSARTAPDGTCVVAGLREVPYVAGAFTEAAPPIEHEFAVAEGRDHEATFTLAPGKTLRVVARDRVTGAPLAGARVDLAVRPPEGEAVVEIGAGPLASTRTDPNGVASFPGLEDREYLATVVPPERHDDHVHHPGAFSVTVIARPGTDAEARLDPPVAARLQVVDAVTGEPVRDVRYEAQAEWDAYDRTGGTPVDVRGAAAEPQEVLVIEGLRAGPWRFRVLAPGYHPLRTAVVQVVAGAEPTRVALRPATGAATGRLVAKADGAPVGGATVSAYEWIASMGDGQRTSARTDAAGRFRLAPLLGEGVPLRLEIRAPGFVPLVWGQEAAARREDLGDLALVRSVRLHGVLVDAAGRPRPSIEVFLTTTGEPRRKGEGATATTDEQGRFAFEEVAPGRLGLLAPGADLLTVDAVEGADLVVRLEPAAAPR